MNGLWSSGELAIFSPNREPVHSLINLLRNQVHSLSVPPLLLRKCPSRSYIRVFSHKFLKLTYTYYSFSIQYALYISLSSPPHLKSKLVLAGINTTVPRLTVIDTEDVSMLPDPDIAIAILGPFKAWNLYMAQLDGI